MKKIKIGIFGLGRGMSFAKSIMLCNGDIVAICDKQEKKIAEAKKQLGEDVTCYSDFDSFIQHEGMEAVLLANYFNDHARFAIRCLEKGIHVLSECTAGGTLAECVALVRAAEKSNAIYMLAENYPYMKFNQEMKRVCDGGTLGKIMYAEGEYNHPVAGDDAEFYRTVIPTLQHWRNYLPRTYYITHSLAPIMYATGAFPKRVTAMPVYAPYDEKEYPYSVKMVQDRAAIVTILNHDDSVFKVTGCAAYGAHGNSYRICGERGQIENVRGMGDKVMLRYNAWDVPEGKQEINLYEPSWNDKDEALIDTAGHGGGDFFVVRNFLQCIREGKQHPFDVYFATAMSAVAILAHRSVMSGGMPYDIPDFRLEAERVKYENDTVSPFIGVNGEAPSVDCDSHNGAVRPTDEQIANFVRDIENA